MQNAAFDIGNVEARIAELEASFENLREFKPDLANGYTSNNSCCIHSCMTF